MGGRGNKQGILTLEKRKTLQRRDPRLMDPRRGFVSDSEHELTNTRLGPVARAAYGMLMVCGVPALGGRWGQGAEHMLESGAASALDVGGPRGDETLGRLVRVRGGAQGEGEGA